MPRFLLTLLATTIACASGSGPGTPIVPPPPPPSPDATSILMLGNSLTYTQDVPGMVADFATAGGAPRPVVASIAFANWSLEEHFNNDASRGAIDGGGFDVVVMQQGPSTLPSSRDHLILWSGRLRDLIVDAGSRGGLYAVWPPLGDDLEAGIMNYTDAANQNSLALYPVAQAFREARRLDPTLPLTTSDNFHPTATGAALAGMVIAATIFDQDPSGYPNPLPTVIDPDDMVTMRAAARYAVQTFGRR
ncbi:MAG: hypothetical protein AB7N73_04945 [Gemmatimonadales bacterium]